jgi:imidazolonepropionase-like amidohydrolase
MADIVAVCGNPLDDIRTLTRRVAFVMKAGRVEIYDKDKAICAGN